MDIGRERRATIADVAARAGVSLGAVSFALNNRPGVGAATRERILAAAAELRWTPSVRAVALSRSRAFALGLVIARQPKTLGADPFFPAFIAGVETVLAEVGQSLVLNVVPDAEAEELTYRRLADNGRVDGVFLTDLRESDPRIGILADLRIPAVTLGRPDIASPFASIELDDAAGMTALVNVLIEHGHTAIAHVSGPDHFLHVRSRRDAWRDALAAAGLPPGPLVAADFRAAGGGAATEDLLARPDRPTAIMYGNDVMAIAGMAVAQQRGVRLPSQLSITGFDDIELASHLYPQLSTVRSNPYEWGQVATRSLLRAVDGHPAEDVGLAPAQMVPRASIARAPRPTRTRNSASAPASRASTTPHHRQENL